VNTLQDRGKQNRDQYNNEKGYKKHTEKDGVVFMTHYGHDQVSPSRALKYSVRALVEDPIESEVAILSGKRSCEGDEGEGDEEVIGIDEKAETNESIRRTPPALDPL